METVNVNGVDLEYEEAGTGEPVLLIPNGPIAACFLPFMSASAMTERYRLIRYRQRGQAGRPSPAPVNFAQHAADAAALLGRLGVHSAHAVGHSTGACIALEMAVAYPGLVHSLVLLEPPLPAATSAPEFFERAVPAFAAHGAGDREGAMATFLSLVSGLEWEVCRAALERSVPGSVAQAISDADNLFESVLPALSGWEFNAERAARVSQPALSVLGSDSEQLFSDSHELLRSWLPRCQEATLSGVGHLLYLQRLEPVPEAVAGFLEQNPLAGRKPQATERRAS
jgi:pimeloyl-ACP methyl ester carboxylesterase